MSGGRRRLPESITSSILAVAAVSDVSCLEYSFEAFDEGETRTKIGFSQHARRGEISAAPGPERHTLQRSWAMLFSSGTVDDSLVFSTKKFGAIDLGLQLVVIRPNRESCGWKDSPVRNPPITRPWKLFLPSLQAGPGDRLLALYLCARGPRHALSKF